MDYWDMLEELISSNAVVIDRKKGSGHPVFDEMIYPADYGYIRNTKSMDGNGIDIFIGEETVKSVNGILCVIDMRKRDSEIKVLYGCSDKEMERIRDFLNNGKYMKALFMARKSDTGKSAP